MYVDAQVKQALSDNDDKVIVRITCSGYVSRVESVLEELGIEITGGTPEFLLLNARIDQKQLTSLNDVKGIGAIELEHEPA